MSRAVLEQTAAYQAGFGEQFYGAVTAGESDYFAAWIDLRVGGNNPTGYDLYAQRIRTDGTNLYPGSLKLLRDPAREATGVPAVAWGGGDDFLVAWHEGAALYGMRVASDGTLRDPAGFLIDSRSTSLEWPAVASDGSGGFLVVQAAAGSIYATRVAGDGTVLDPVPLVVASGATALGYPKVAYGDGVYMVVWVQTPNQAVWAARVTPQGQVLDPGGVNISGGGADIDAHIDFDGQNFYVVWQRRNGVVWDIYGAHVDPQGTPVSGPRLLLDGGAQPFVVTWAAQVGFNGSDHLIAFSTSEPLFLNSDLWAIRVDRDGVPGSPFPVSTLEGRSQDSFGVATIGSQFFVLWQGNYARGTEFVHDTQAARIDASGLVLDTPAPLEVSTGAAWQTNSATSFDGQQFVTVFEDWREGKPGYQPDLYAIRTAIDGTPIDASAFPVATALGQPLSHPDSVFGGGQHAIVYESPFGAVRMARVLPDGTVPSGPNGTVIFTNDPTGATSRPKIAWDGQRYCVAWHDNLLLTGQKPLQYALVNTLGQIEAGPFHLAPSTDASFHFDVAAVDDGFLIAWYAFGSTGGAVWVAHVDSAGSLLDTRLVESTGSWLTEQVKLASNGQSCIVAWARYNDGRHIYARRLSRNGEPTEPTFVVAGQDAIPLAILTSGTDYFIMGSRRDAQVDGNLTTFRVRLGPSGSAVDPEENVFVGRRFEHYGDSSFATAPSGRAIMAVSFWADDPYNAPRVQGVPFMTAGCGPDITTGAIPAQPGYLVPNGILNNDDFFAFLGEFAAGNLAVADLTTGAVAGQPGYGVPNGILNNDDFFYYLAIFAAGC
ncbi:MAG: GC-type dockerin domain-anchored protein [Phycisphaerales bacterium]